jgi:hypothetical protein
MDANNAWTRGRDSNISRWIEHLINKARELRNSTPPVKSVPVEIEDGMYVLDGEVYKVIHAVHGSGRQYAKLLTKSGFTVAPGIVSRLRSEHRMTLDQAQKYGRLYGVCCRCGTTLTDESSIEAGIGPVCATKF